MNTEGNNKKTVEEQLYEYVAEQLIKNQKSKQKVVEELVGKGIPESDANSIVDNIHTEIMKAKRKKRISQIIGGALLLLVGGLATAHSDNKIYIGALILGGVYLIIGLFGLIGNLLTLSKRSRIWVIVVMLVIVAAAVLTDVLRKSRTKEWEDYTYEKEEVVTIVPLNSDEIFTVNGSSFTMKPVEGGTFQMGSDDEDAKDDEKPIHSVTVSSFYMSETEVTQKLWKAVMGTIPSVNRGDNLPIDNISWHDCQEFIQKLNQLTGRTFRVPTEAEWEYAARGGKYQSSCKYSGSNSINDVAWYESTTKDKGTKPVKTKQPNALGLYDMSGNVWEMCSDMYGEYSECSQINPEGPLLDSYHVLRGGGCYANAEECRVSNRLSDEIKYFPNSNGFRLVLVP